MVVIVEGVEGVVSGCCDYVVLFFSECYGGGVVVDGYVLYGVYGGVGEGVVFDYIVGVGFVIGFLYLV